MYCSARTCLYITCCCVTLLCALLRFKQHKYLQFSIIHICCAIRNKAGGCKWKIVLFDAENCFAKKLNDSCCARVHSNNNEMEKCTWKEREEKKKHRVTDTHILFCHLWIWIKCTNNCDIINYIPSSCPCLHNVLLCIVFVYSCIPFVLCCFCLQFWRQMCFVYDNTCVCVCALLL